MNRLVANFLLVLTAVVLTPSVVTSQEVDDEAASYGLPIWLLVAAMKARGPVGPEPPPHEPFQGFRRATSESGISFYASGEKSVGDVNISDFYTNSAASGDFDGDGDIDLFLVQDSIPAFYLYRNNGDMTFEEISDQVGITQPQSKQDASRGSPAFVDLNGDGSLDLLVLGLQGSPSLIFLNDGAGGFERLTVSFGLDFMHSQYSFSPAFADYDLDGDLDLALGHWGTSRLSNASRNETETLWRNDSNPQQIWFTPVSLQSGISPSILNLNDPLASDSGVDFSFTPGFADIDLDGDADLLVASDFSHSQWFINLGERQFNNATDHEVLSVTSGMGSAIADFDNDGDMDWFVTAIFDKRATLGGDTGNALYRNDSGIFSDVSLASDIQDGGWGWGACAADFDNDGDIDIFHTNGWPTSKADESRLFLNDGFAKFVETADKMGVIDLEEGRGVICADLDDDGDIDLVQLKRATTDQQNQIDIWENLATANYLQVSLRGVTPNTGAVGARLELSANGLKQFREVRLGSNFLAHDPLRQHFGLQDTSVVDELAVRWPDGRSTVLVNIAANQHLVVEQPDRGGALVSVSNASGSGVYLPGDTVQLEATAPEEGYAFSHWSLVGEGSLEDEFSAGTRFTVGNSDVSVTANYIPGPSMMDSVSAARRWMAVVLEAIRKDFARPVVHARNLFHISAVLYDAWSVTSGKGVPWLAGQSRLGVSCPVPEEAYGFNAVQLELAMGVAVATVLEHRFVNAPGATDILRDARVLAQALALAGGYDPTDDPLAAANDWGHALGNCYIALGLADGANELSGYANVAYEPVNPPLTPHLPGNPNLEDANRFQPLSLPEYVDQSGNLINAVPEFLGAEWGSVYPFSLDPADAVEFERGGWTYPVYFDQGPPPTYGSGLDEFYRWGFAMVALWSAHLDPADGVMIDISPASIGNLSYYPSTWDEVRDFYDELQGGDVSQGRETNPVTGNSYTSQWVRRGDYTRVLAEFWADGPNSETPPGHWFVILNTVMEHPMFSRQMQGAGPELEPLEWDVKAYMALGGAMHDSAIAAWSMKGWYDYIRPISALRAMAVAGQSSEPQASDFSVYGLPLIQGRIERVAAGDPLAGAAGEHIGKLKVYAWRGTDYVADPAVDTSGVGWILGENWWPYQRPTFVTPPFAGYVSGHSTYSSAAAVVLESLTGDPFFPGGKSEFRIIKDDFLVFESGPSEDMVLEWATYQDAADQCSLSRIWGGIHPPIDDIPGRIIGRQVGARAFAEAKQLFDAVPN
jgi:hypothetical protein